MPDVAEAKRFFNYPYAAIEEALANAVYHKGYDEREPIEVRILPDRIEIVSHPGADRSVSIEGLSSYKVFGRRYRNRRIGEFLKELHLTEGRNTGFRKIINALKQNGSPLPVFETDEGRYSFAVTIYRHPEFPEGVDGGECVGEIVGDTGPNNVPDVPNNEPNEPNNVPNNEPDEPNNVHNVYETGPSVHDNVHDVPNNEPNEPNNVHDVPNNEPNEPNNVMENRICTIIDLIKSDLNISLPRLAEILNVNRITIRRDIDKLRAEGIIERVGPTHGGYWRVKTDNVFIHKQGVQQ